MMGIARTFKLKGWVIACILTLVFLFFVSRNSFIAPKQTNVVLTTSAIAAVGEAYNRLSASHQQLLNSALAHIRLGYVANRTPDVSTPPLLVLYSAHQQQQEQKSLDERLVDITSSYYFSMLQPGSAFAYDMTWPVKMEWYFEPAPIYMAMNTHQAQFYKNEAQPHQIEFHPHQFTEDELLETPFMEHFAERGIKIISTTDSSSSTSSTPMWMTLRENPSMQGARDKYRLNHLTQKSDWFWLTSRLLFSKPSGGWFAQQLEPYRDLMGGRLDYSESYSPLDPHARKVTPEFIATKQQWLRVGLRLGDVDTTAKEIHALTAHIARLCQPQQQSIHCHVFISAPNRNLLQAARSSMTKHKMAVHAIAEGYPFADLNDDDGSEKDETTLKKKYARTFMDWMILSRMDYLVGQQNDGFLKTAAWAAQVQTDVSIENGRIIPMSDW